MAACGDGVTRRDLQPGEANYEACDDGNAVDTDACTSGCTVAVCGDGVVRLDLAEGAEGFEACDDGNAVDEDACVGCQPARCGDGTVREDLNDGDDGFEECDDGNSDDGDGCSAQCENEITCQRMGWKYGRNDWSCPNGLRMPTRNEWNRVEPCVTQADQARFGYYRDVAISVGGCNCKWNRNWCGQPSIETIRGGRMCGDYDSLHICVR